VINGTDVTGASEPLSDAVTAEGFEVGRIDALENGAAARTEVLFLGDAKPEAQRVARALRVDLARVGPARGEVERRARNADVVVLVGEDRARP